MEHTFTEAKCLEYIEKAKKRVNGKFDGRDFLVDATDAVNMLFKDGDQYTFIHRSFQEYFTAYAVTHYFVKPIRQILKKLPRREADSVFAMAREMNPAVIDDLYLVPEYDELSRAIAGMLRATDPLEILRLADYKIEFGFQVRGRRFSPYMYGAGSTSEMETFIETAYLMLKHNAPQEMHNIPSNAAILTSLRNFGRHLAKNNLPRRKERVVEAEIDLARKMIDVRDRPYGEDDVSDSNFFSVSLEDINWKKDFPVISELSKRIKSRCVFVKRSIDDIKRNYRKARDTSDDILSM
jgi:hypothetical protein